MRSPVVAVALALLLPLPPLPPIPGLPLAPPGEPVHVHIADFDYDPATAYAVVGQPVAWDNHDAAHHTVTAYDGAFDSGSLGQDEDWTWTFEAPGTYGYFCDPHPWMTGEVVVSDAPLPLPLPLSLPLPL